MANHTSAILAINSLDRYNTNKPFIYSRFEAEWNSGDDFLTVTLIPGATGPIVGATIAPGYAAQGIPDGTTITAWDPVTEVADISNATTLSNPGPGPVVILAAYQQQLNYYINDSLFREYDNDANNPGNNFIITSQSSLIYGYITKIMISQIQLQYNIPTVNLTLNDTFYIADHATRTNHAVTIPHGFYYPDELAAAIQVLIRNISPTWANMNVTFVPRDGFHFVDATPVTPLDFYFPSYLDLQTNPPFIDNNQVQTLLKTYRLLGITNVNAYNAIPSSVQISVAYPIFLYTPYIDFYSDTLTNYQSIKDTSSSVNSPKGLIARLYLSGTGNIQETGSLKALGTASFIMTADLNTPKVIEWTPDVTVTAIDIQLRDCYGDLIPGYQDGYSTEFQMTLLCTEER